MRGRFWSIVPLLLSALSGCIGDDGTGVKARMGTDDAGTDLPPWRADVVPLEPDLWGNDTERVLFDGVVEAVDCNGGAFWAPYGAMAGTTFTTGCARVPFEEGVLVPPGTETLRVHGDATEEGRTLGPWYLLVWTMGRNTWEKAFAGSTDQKDHVWEVDLTPRDWDDPSRLAGLLRVEIWAGNGEHGAHLAGPVDINVSVLRDSAWAPRPRVDHWNLTLGLHGFAQENATVVLNTTTDFAYTQSPTSYTSTETDVVAPPFTGIVPHGTDHLVVGLHWAFDDCIEPPGMGCRAFADTYSDDAMSRPFVESRDWGERYTVWVLDAPRQVVWDDDDATTSRTWLSLYVLWDCENSLSTCGAASAKGTMTYRVEAWQGAVDLDAFKVRLGAV